MGKEHDRLDAAAIRAWTWVFTARAAVVVVSSAIGVALGTIEGPLYGVIALMVPYLIFQIVRFRRTHRLERYLPVCDITIACACAIVSPDTWTAIVPIAPAVVALAVVMFGWTTAVATGGVGAVLIGVAAARAPEDGAAGFTGYITGAVLVLVAVAYAHSGERRTHKRYSDLLNGIDGIVWEWDTGTHELALVSTQVEAILGWTVEEALDLDTWRRNSLDPATTPDQAVRAALEGGFQSVEFAVRHTDGHTIWLRNRLRVRRNDSGELESIQGILIDTTELRANQLAVQQLADVVENMQTVTTIWQFDDPEHPENARLVRRADSRIGVDYTEGRIGERLLDIFPDVSTTTLIEYLNRAVSSGTSAAMPDISWLDQRGTEHWYAVRVLPLTGSCFAVLTDDVTEQHEIEATLRRQALHDSLTGLPNRALVSDRLARSLSEARRTDQAVALLIMDLNQFKEVNDTLGHPVGDCLLIEVAARLAHALRDCDTVARLGGDEFAVLLTTDATYAGAKRVAERIGMELARPYELEGVTLRASASIGIAISPEHGDDAGTLTQHADIAMYNAKRMGSGWAFYSPDDDHTSVRRLAYANELDDALARDELILHYQPQIDLATEAVIGIEALVRWSHPKHGVLLPIEFIEVAEVCGAIQPLTHWVIRTAVARAAQLQRSGHDLAVSLNLSGRNLYDPTLAAHIGASLHDFGVAPDRIILELTERDLFEDPSQVLSALSLLSDLGVRVSIDDFGTGWSSLATLARLPVHQLKIDRSFVSRMVDDQQDASIVQSIIDLGHNLGLSVIAEGIDSEATIHALRARQCDEGQGYFVSKPLPGDRLVEWLAAPERKSSFRTSGK